MNKEPAKNIAKEEINIVNNNPTQQNRVNQSLLLNKMYEQNKIFPYAYYGYASPFQLPYYSSPRLPSNNSLSLPQAFLFPNAGIPFPYLRAPIIPTQQFNNASKEANYFRIRVDEEYYKKKYRELL